jgi:transposase
MVEFMQQGTTVEAEIYCKTLKKLRRAIQKRRRGMLTSRVLVVLLHDNACQRTAAYTRALLEHCNWELFEHPPCSPDLALRNYHLLIYLKNWLRLQFFNNNELIEGVKM